MPEWRVKSNSAPAPRQRNAADGHDKVQSGTQPGHQPPPHGHDLPDVKTRIHRLLIERLNLSNLDRMEREQVNHIIAGVVKDLLEQESIPLNVEERDRLISQVLDEIFGLGPLQPLMEDPTISDILVDTWARVLIERDGKLQDTNVRFQDDKHLFQVIDRIVSAVGRRIDDSSPMVDARLPDGSRVNAIVPPLSIDGPHLSIRKFKQDVMTAENLVGLGTITEPIADFVRAIVGSRLNVLICGGTGAGKTTLLNVLSSFIPPDERIITIEDSAELQLRQPRVVRLETRTANVEGHGAVDQRQLVINALRMRPDRIVIGEVRGSEAIDMLQAMNTGHDGSLTTLHANSPRDAFHRIETMVAMANLNLPDRAVRQQIAGAIDIVIQLKRFGDGKRRLTQLSEVVGMEGEVITIQDIFEFEQEGVDERGNILGQIRPTGIRPVCTEVLRTNGFQLPSTMFSDHRSAA